MLLTFSSLSACQTTQPRVDITPASKEGAWTAKALIEDKRKNKTNTVELDMVARRPAQLRMEVTTRLGIHLASLAFTDSTMSYILTRQKRYVSGPAEPERMRDLISVPLDPRTIVDLLFDRPLDPIDWRCEVDEVGQAKSCVKIGGSLIIAWLERAADKRLISVRAPAVNVTLSLKEARSKVQISDELFRLSAPEGFRAVRIQ